MDMRSKDILKNAIMKYDGTVIVVSHDREFLDGMVSKVYEFRNGGEMCIRDSFCIGRIRRRHPTAVFPRPREEAGQPIPSDTRNKEIDPATDRPLCFSPY